MSITITDELITEFGDRILEAASALLVEHLKDSVDRSEERS